MNVARWGLAWAVTLVACAPARLPVPPPEPFSEVRAYLESWNRGDLAQQRAFTQRPPADFDQQHQRFRDDLQITSSRYELLDLNGAMATVRSTHALKGLGVWEIESKLPFVRVEGRWLLQWTPAVLHPLAQPGDRFIRTAVRPRRADLLDGRGDPLTREGDIITVGVDPNRIQSLDSVVTVLSEQLGMDPEKLAQWINTPRARWVPIIDLRAERFQQVRPVLEPVLGIFFRKRVGRLSPAEGFAAHTLGRVGADGVGISGLERAFESQLAGIAGGEIRIRANILQHFPGTPGSPLKTTLLPEIQLAAEKALSDTSLPAALVALDAATGDVLAVASRPLNEPLHRALTGRYPPGSTFKIVTAEVLLNQGLTPETAALCPEKAVIAGKTFKNFEGESLKRGTQLKSAFAHSCN
ncbi:MAG: penicillin-binding transpeptidase domain-containing protein, partial [Myxococcaceae bacterium]